MIFPGYSHYCFTYLLLFLRVPSCWHSIFYCVSFISSDIPPPGYTFWVSLTSILPMSPAELLPSDSLSFLLLPALPSPVSFPVAHSLFALSKAKGFVDSSAFPFLTHRPPRRCHLPYVKWEKFKQTNVITSSRPTELSHHLLVATLIFISFPFCCLPCLR